MVTAANVMMTVGMGMLVGVGLPGICVGVGDGMGGVGDGRLTGVWLGDCGGGGLEVSAAVGDRVAAGNGVSLAAGVADGKFRGGRRVRVGVRVGVEVRAGLGVPVGLGVVVGVSLGDGLLVAVGDKVALGTAAVSVSTTPALSGLSVRKSRMAESGKRMGPVTVWPPLVMINCCKLVRVMGLPPLSKVQVPARQLIVRTSSTALLGSEPIVY